MSSALLPSQLSAMRALFDAADAKRAGSLAWPELRPLLAAVGVVLPQQELERIALRIGAVARPGDDRVDFDGFVALLCDPLDAHAGPAIDRSAPNAAASAAASSATVAAVTPSRADRDLSNLFARLDRDGDGRLSSADLEQSSLRTTFTQDELAEVVQLADTEGKGSVSKRDFQRLFGAQPGT